MINFLLFYLKKPYQLHVMFLNIGLNKLYAH